MKKIILIPAVLGASITMASCGMPYDNAFNYRLLEDDTYEVIGVRKKRLKSAEIPSELNGKKVSGIGANAFEDSSLLESVILPEGMTFIDEYAFYDCTQLRSILIPDSVTSISYTAFARCYGLYENDTDEGICYFATENNDYFMATGTIYKRYFPAELHAKDDAIRVQLTWFGPCPDETSQVNIEDGCRFIFSGAFGSMPYLTEVSLPSSLVSMGDTCFNDCSLLETVTYSGTVEMWESILDKDNVFENCPMLTEITCSDGSIPLA